MNKEDRHFEINEGKASKVYLKDIDKDVHDTRKTFMLEASCHISHCLCTKVSSSLPDDQNSLKRTRGRLYKGI